MIRVSLLIVACIALCTSAMNAADFYLQLSGIEGSSRLGDAAGAIEVHSFSWGIVSPRDAASGLPTGKRMHKPLHLTLELDKASPQLILACATGQHIKEAKLTVRKLNPNGGAENYYTITLIDCMVSSAAIDCDDDSDGDGLDDSKLTQSISLTYQKIKWEFIGGPVGEDDWEEAK